MEDTPEVMTIEWAALRSPTEVSITCRPFTSSGTIRSSEGVMHNFSSEGSYIETTENYSARTILIVRMVGYPYISESMVDEVRPRAICLAEARRHQQLDDENAVRYGMRLKYLD
jgi:hypothetical protein